jgi:hypothetical protein
MAVSVNPALYPSYALCSSVAFGASGLALALLALATAVFAPRARRL